LSHATLIPSRAIHAISFFDPGVAELW